MLLERDVNLPLDLADYQFGLSIAMDIENRTHAYLVLALTQWVATIRQQEREECIPR